MAARARATGTTCCGCNSHLRTGKIVALCESFCENHYAQHNTNCCCCYCCRRRRTTFVGCMYLGFLLPLLLLLLLVAMVAVAAAAMLLHLFVAALRVEGHQNHVALRQLLVRRNTEGLLARDGRHRHVHHSQHRGARRLEHIQHQAAHARAVGVRRPPAKVRRCHCTVRRSKLQTPVIMLQLLSRRPDKVPWEEERKNGSLGLVAETSPTPVCH